MDVSLASFKRVFSSVELILSQCNYNQSQNLGEETGNSLTASSQVEIGGLKFLLLTIDFTSMIAKR